MIQYHGTPITPHRTLIGLSGHHFFVSFWRPDNIGIVSEIAQSFALDNGAFSAWTKGVTPDWSEYKEFVERWERHPAYDWHIIPDVIDGSEADNDRLIETWGLRNAVPVWHLHESTSRLRQMVASFDRIALGSSGEYEKIGDCSWWQRIGEAMDVICDPIGRPMTKIHGLRMLDNKLRRIPFASADSTNVAQNLTDKKMTREAKAFVVSNRIESEQSAATWELK